MRRPKRGQMVWRLAGALCSITKSAMNSFLREALVELVVLWWNDSVFRLILSPKGKGSTSSEKKTESLLRAPFPKKYFFFPFFRRSTSFSFLGLEQKPGAQKSGQTHTLNLELTLTTLNGFLQVLKGGGTRIR